MLSFVSNNSSQPRTSRHVRAYLRVPPTVCGVARARAGGAAGAEPGGGRVQQPAHPPHPRAARVRAPSQHRRCGHPHGTSGVQGELQKGRVSFFGRAAERHGGGARRDAGSRGAVPHDHRPHQRGQPHCAHQDLRAPRFSAGASSFRQHTFCAFSLQSHHWLRTDSRGHYGAGPAQGGARPSHQL